MILLTIYCIIVNTMTEQKVDSRYTHEKVNLLPFKPIPLVKPFIEWLNNQRLFFYPKDYNDLIIGGDQELKESYYLSLTVRYAGDNTGILGPLIGVSRNPKQTKNIIISTGQELFEDLSNTHPNPNSVLLVLDKVKNPTIEDIRTINLLTGKAVKKIKLFGINLGYANQDSPLDGMTPQAWRFRENNRVLARKLVQEQGSYDKLFHRRLIFDEINHSLISDIKQAPMLPKIDSSPLLEILPDELNRNIYEEAPSAADPLGLVARLNMAGSDILRSLLSVAEVKEIGKKYEERRYR